MKTWCQNHRQVSSRTRFCRQYSNLPTYVSEDKDVTKTAYLCIYLCIYYQTAIVNKPITNWAVWRQLFPTAVSISLFFFWLNAKKEKENKKYHKYVEALFRFFFFFFYNHCMICDPLCFHSPLDTTALPSINKYILK